MDEEWELRTDQGVPRRMTDSLPVRRSTLPISKTDQQAVATMKAKKAMSLSRLALHFYRPDFSEQHARLLIDDMVRDLKRVTPEDVERACKLWRTNEASRFFPTSGQLLAMLKNPFKDSPAASHGFYKAPPEEIERDIAEQNRWRKELQAMGAGIEIKKKQAGDEL